MFRKRLDPKKLLPTKSVPISVAGWWKVHIGIVSEEDAKMLTEKEKEMVDLIIDTEKKSGPIEAGFLDKPLLESLYQQEFVYLSVPINDADCIIVPPLEGFVMNRVMGDSFENLLYKIFVSIDEHTPILELAALLRIDIQLVYNIYIYIGRYCCNENLLVFIDIFLGNCRLKMQSPCIAA